MTPEQPYEQSAPLILAEPEAPFWGFGEVFILAALYLIASMLVVSMAMAVLHERARLGYAAVAEDLIAYLILFAVLKALFFWHQRPLLKSLGWVRQPFSPSSLIIVGLALVALSFVLQIALQTPNIETPFSRMLDSDALSRFVVAIFGVTAAPVIEELLFRGFLQPVFVNALGVFPGILTTSALFGALHLAQNAGIWQTGVLITLAGFGFGVVRHVSGSTRASALAHAAYNSLPCILTLVLPNHK
ncbi:MAG TPA: type II CAAX endopeptidase family protein [Bryobacteraceae bacterium]|nr:type II CAAX endopeptidase family protein [Bryobacteraceae bacterium]